MNASTESRLEQSYNKIANVLQIPNQRNSGSNVFRLVCNWLRYEANDGWLIILDNADDEGLFENTPKDRYTDAAEVWSESPLPLSTYLPQTSNGLVLVTSRNRSAAFRLVGNNKNIITVWPMSVHESSRMFSTRFSGICTQDDVNRLTKQLEYLPLAISQAAAYLSQGTLTVREYMTAFSKAREVIDADFPDLRRDPTALNSATKTLQASFDHLYIKTPSPVRLLALMSLFDHDDIPDYLVRDYVVNEDFEPSAKSKDELDQAFRDDVTTLRSYSLLVIGSNSDSFSIHRLVKLSMQRWLDTRGELDIWKLKYLKILSAAFPSNPYVDWGRVQRLFPHAEAALEYIPIIEHDWESWAAIILPAARLAEATGRYNRAQELIQTALGRLDEGLGPDHLVTLTAISDLGSVLRHQGKYEAAKEMNQRALQGREKALGVEHPDTLASVSNLALILQGQGKYEAAEKIYRRALQGYEKALGVEHPDTLASVSNLALVLQDQGKYETAKKMNQRALQEREKALGVEHLDTLASVSNLALILRDQGKYEAAEEMNQRALQGREKALGVEHPDTLASVSNLALILQGQGKYEAAKEMNRRALQGREKTLGVEHPDTLVSNLTLISQDQSKYEVTKEMNQRVLQGREKALEVEHLDTLASVSNLTLISRDQGKYEATKEMNRRTLQERENTLGVEHPDTLASVDNLALIQEGQGKYEETKKMNQRALQEREKALRAEHLDTLANIYSRPYRAN